MNNDKKFYIMGAVTNFDKDGSGIELEGIYRRHIRKNDKCRCYSYGYTSLFLYNVCSVENID